MDQRDQELLDRQMRAINPAPRHDGVIIVTVLVVFFAGMTVGGILAESANAPMHVAMNDTVPLQPDGLPLSMRLRREPPAATGSTRYSSGSVVKNSG